MARAIVIYPNHLYFLAEKLTLLAIITGRNNFVNHKSLSASDWASGEPKPQKAVLEVAVKIVAKHN